LDRPSKIYGVYVVVQFIYFVDMEYEEPIDFLCTLARGATGGRSMKAFAYLPGRG
jgi:hypothetical protein